MNGYEYIMSFHTTTNKIVLLKEAYGNRPLNNTLCESKEKGE